MRLLNSIALIAPRLAGRAAFFLFGYTGTRAALRPDERDVHAAAAVGSLTINGKRVMTYRWGDGRRPVLLIHGWQSRASRFAHFIPGLTALGYTPVSFDAPGNGDSGGRTTNALEYRTTVLEMQTRYGTFEAVIAHSFGVTCAFLALRSGLRAGRLVAISGVTNFDHLVTAFVRQAGMSGRLETQLRRRTEQVVKTNGLTWSRMSVTHEPGEVDVPILVIHDDTDRVVDHAHATKIADAYGERARLVGTSGLGHHRILGDPAVVNAATAFVTEPDAVRTVRTR